MPVAARANHGAATTSTKVSASSLRQTNELHSGCSEGRIRPTRSHFATTVTPAATRPAASSTGPPRSTAHHGPRSSSAVRAPTTSTTRSTCVQTGTTRHSLDRAPGDPQPQRRACGCGRRRPRRARGGARAVGCRATRCPALAVPRRGAADSTATSACFGTVRPGAAIPELPTNAPLPTRTCSTRSQPPPSSYPPTRVSSARKAPGADPHERRDHQHRGGLDARADVGPQGAQPRRGQGRGVQREQPGPGLVEHAQDRPRLPGLPAVHRVRGRPRARARAAAPLRGRGARGR